ncbi:MAG: sulfurtransferase, partial [Alphaproteobacteria bacterium]|nr:sulfurtransferase [Alphaproteobacteria bacterium]
MTDALITPEQLKDMEGVVIIDTRAPEAYAAGHIPGAVNLHEIFTFLATSDPDGIAQMTDTFAAAFGAAGL